MLTASGDPAAASCSFIATLQNILINPWLKENIVNMEQQGLVEKMSEQQENVINPDQPAQKEVKSIINKTGVRPTNKSILSQLQYLFINNKIKSIFGLSMVVAALGYYFYSHK